MTQCKYWHYFNSRSAPTAFMIKSLVSHFEELGSMTDHHGRGAHQNICTEDSVETVRQCCRRSICLNLPSFQPIGHLQNDFE
ncbi:hypothetical protein TNCV_3532241 [Trichonephila clavipes]|nr:hypothetical protein TNCV_3532241 [Trichonephila clavipes]